MQKGRRCYGYLAQRKRSRYFVIHCLETRIFSSCITLTHTYFTSEYTPLKEKIRIPARPCDILQECSTETPEKFLFISNLVSWL